MHTLRKFQGDYKLMNTKLSALLLASFWVCILSGAAGAAPDDSKVSIPLTSVPTFSTKNIARQGHFYVGGNWTGEPGKERIRGAMYVDAWVPKKIRHPYPIVFVQAGRGQTNIPLPQS